MRNQQECCIDWLSLPREITLMILQKAGVLYLLLSAQFVCTQWREICTHPSTWSIIRVVDYCKFYETHQRVNVKKMIKWAVDQSYGSLFDLDLDYFMSPHLLDYVLERCAQIKRLRIRYFIEDEVESVAAKLTFLEHLDLVDHYNLVSSDGMETLGSNCPRLTSLKIRDCNDEEATAIARSIPQLRRICFFGTNFVTDVGVEALLDGCPHLESLDIQQCYILGVTGAKQKMMKKPLTPTQWRDILEDPCTWSTIRVPNWMFCVGYIFPFDIRQEFVNDLVRRAVDKSCGGLLDLDLDYFMSEYMLSYVVERCTQIRRLRGCMSESFSEETLRAAALRLPLLEDLQLKGGMLPYYKLSAESIQTLGKCCPRLTSLEIPTLDDQSAKTLAISLPQLRHLKPSNASNLTDVGVKALLNGCSHLESLNLLGCNPVRLSRTLVIKCAQKIKHPFCSTFFIPRKKDNQIFEEDVYDVNYTIDTIAEYWSRRQKARGREAHIRQLRRDKVNKNKLNGTKRGHAQRRREKARRRREIRTNSKREVENEFVYWNINDGYQLEDDDKQFIEEGSTCCWSIGYQLEDDDDDDNRSHKTWLTFSYCWSIGYQRECTTPCGSIGYQSEDHSDYNQLLEEVFDVQYMKDCRTKGWSRRVIARGKETRTRQLRREKVNKNTKRYQNAQRRREKARRRREIRAYSEREVKEEFVYWNINDGYQTEDDDKQFVEEGSTCCWSIGYQTEDHYDCNQLLEEDVYGVHYMKDSRRKCWRRRVIARAKETHIRQLRKEKVNKNRLNSATKRYQKARTRMEFKTYFRREVKKDVCVIVCTDMILLF